MTMDLFKLINVGVIGSGGDPNSEKGDFDDSQSAHNKVYNQLQHGGEVKLDDLGFWGSALNPSSSSQSQFPGVPDPGTPVYYIKNTGQNGGIILGISNAILNGGLGEGASGGQSLMNDVVKELMSRDIGVSIPPNIQEGEDRGAKIRKISEKGQKHSLSLLDGLPIHGALFEMAGFKLPELPRVPTARQTNDKMMTQDMLGQMQQMLGQVMSLGQLFQQLKSNGPGGSPSTSNSGGGLGPTGQSHWDIIHDALPPAMTTALNSLSNLIQGHETDQGVSYVTGGAVHTGIYLENAVELLSKAKSIEDLMYVMQRLQWDTSIMGQDKLDTLEYEIENAWGVGLQQVSANGLVTITYANSNSQMEFANSMSNSIYNSAATSAPPPSYTNSNATGGGGFLPPPSSSGSGGSGGQQASQIAQQAQSLMGQLFGNSSEIMQDMWKRLAPSGEKTATELHKTLTQNSEAEMHKEINKATADGGDPTDSSHYQDTGFSVSFLE